jgi:hypothetical protein
MPKRRSSPEIEDLVEALIRRLTEAVESAISTRARFLTEDYLRAAAPPPRRPEPIVLAAPPTTALADQHEAAIVEPSPEVPPRPGRAAQRVRQIRQRPAVVAVAKALPAIDPEEQRRTAELARLRAILRPTAPVPSAPPVVAPPLPRAAEEDDSLQALEDHIRDQVPALAGLSQSRCTARIGAWVGRVRLHQTGPDGDRTRIASRILLDKLRNLAWSMDAGTIEGLNISWSTRNWERYIQDNERIASTPDAPSPPKPEPDAAEDVWCMPSEAGTQA